MSKVNVYTYEMYLLDFFESKLNAADTQELVRFLQKHPELEVDLVNNPVDVYAAPNEVIFTRKGALLKNERIDTFADLVIAEMEGCATAEEIATKTSLITEQPHLKREEELLLQTRLEADLSLHFSRKETLFQANKGLMPRLRYWMGAAASVLFLMAVYFFNHRKPVTGIASTTPLEQPISNGVKLTETVSEIPIAFASNETATSANTSSKKSGSSLKQPSNELQDAPLKMDALPLSTFASAQENIHTPKAEKPQQEMPNSTYIAMGEGKLDVNTITEQMAKLFPEEDSTNNDKKGFTIRIGKLVLLHFGHKNK